MEISLLSPGKFDCVIIIVEEKFSSPIKNLVTFPRPSFT